MYVCIYMYIYIYTHIDIHIIPRLTTGALGTKAVVRMISHLGIFGCSDGVPLKHMIERDTPGLHHKISVFSDPDPGKS